MNDTLTWALLIGAAGNVFGFVSFWMALGKRISDAEARAEAAETQGSGAAHQATVAIAKLDMFTREIHSDRVDIVSKVTALEAVSRSTTTALAQAETRLAKSIEDVGAKLDHLNDTLIKTLSELVHYRKERNGGA